MDTFHNLLYALILIHLQGDYQLISICEIKSLILYSSEILGLDQLEILKLIEISQKDLFITIPKSSS